MICSFFWLFLLLFVEVFSRLFISINYYNNVLNTADVDARRIHRTYFTNNNIVIYSTGKNYVETEEDPTGENG